MQKSFEFFFFFFFHFSKIINLDISHEFVCQADDSQKNLLICPGKKQQKKQKQISAKILIGALRVNEIPYST